MYVPAVGMLGHALMRRICKIDVVGMPIRREVCVDGLMEWMVARTSQGHDM